MALNYHSGSTDSVEPARTVGLRWYLTLRWMAICGHVVAVAGAHIYGFELPLGALAITIALEVLISVGLVARPPSDSAAERVLVP